MIAHIDLDAFYAQCEMVRLGVPHTTPLAVQQWDSLIAINYAARPFGVSRMLSVAEAKKRCPELITQHVATFREGEGGKWAYRDDAATSIKTDKVSLDPYRAESRKILGVVKEELSRWRESVMMDVERSSQVQVQPAKLEKASIDEVFIDLSSLVFGVLLQRYPQLQKDPSSEDRIAALPLPPRTALGWNAEDALVDLDENGSEDDDPEWDDVAMSIGSEIIRSIRKAVWEQLSYTCSAGIARNKMIAKLGSACNKPNKQTVVRNRAAQKFLSGYKFTKIRMLGGKLGDQVTALFGTEQVSELLKVPIEELKAKLDDDTAAWLYGIIRGEDHSEVNPRTQIKSMLSAKSFRPSINSAEQAEKWLRIFAADIYGRLVEDGVLENRRRPKTITLHHRYGDQVRSRQIPIPGGKPIDELLLFELAKTLLGQVIADGRVWPCANLSLSVGGFEDGITNNRAIDGFLIRGDEAKSMNTPVRGPDTSGTQEDGQRVEKRRKIEGIERFFTKATSNPDVESATDQQNLNNAELEDVSRQLNEYGDENVHGEQAVPDYPLNQDTSWVCNRCGKSFPEFERIEHEDWHFAKDLESQERQAARASQNIQSATSHSSSVPGKRKAGSVGGGRGRGRPEKGQTRLTFG